MDNLAQQQINAILVIAVHLLVNKDILRVNSAINLDHFTLKI
jgi:hypothetical protein